MNQSRKRVGVIAAASVAILGGVALLPTDSGGPASADALSPYTPYFVYVNMGTGLTGDSVDPAHLKWIEASSVQWGGSLSGAAGTGAGGAVAHARMSASPVVITKGIDRSTPGLYERLAAGTVMPSAVIDIVQSGEGGSRTRLTLGAVGVKSIKATARRADAYSQTGNGEEVELIFGTIKIEHWEPGASRVSTCSSWNITRSIKGSC